MNALPLDESPHEQSPEKIRLFPRMKPLDIYTPRQAEKFGFRQARKLKCFLGLFRKNEKKVSQLVFFKRFLATDKQTV